MINSEKRRRWIFSYSVLDDVPGFQDGNVLETKEHGTLSIDIVIAPSALLRVAKIDILLFLPIFAFLSSTFLRFCAYLHFLILIFLMKLSTKTKTKTLTPNHT